MMPVMQSGNFIEPSQQQQKKTSCTCSPKKNLSCFQHKKKSELKSYNKFICRSFCDIYRCIVKIAVCVNVHFISCKVRHMNIAIESTSVGIFEGNIT